MAKQRLIAGTINRYEAEAGWENTHLDKSPRLLPDQRPPEIVAGIEEIPAEDGAFDEIVCSQVLEHLVHEDALRALGEFFRVLKSGGLLRLDVPDLDKLCRAWVEGRLDREVVSRIVYGDPSNMPDDHLNAHRNGWWRERLLEALTGAGFCDFKTRYEHEESTILFVEARRP